MTEPRQFDQAWVDYFIPSTVSWDETGFPDISHAVMRNLIRVSPTRPYGITHAEVLDEVEVLASYKRMVELSRRPIPGNYDLTHFRTIHHHLFQDVYVWAGELRTAPRDWPMAKMGPDVRARRAGEFDPPPIAHRYLSASEVAPYGTAVLDRVAAKNHLRGLGRDRFLDELTTVRARINYVHPFREGNTRTQFAFFRQPSADAGYDLDPERFQPRHMPHRGPVAGGLREQFVLGRLEYMQTGQIGLLRDSLDAAITELPTPVAPDYDLDALRAATTSHPRALRDVLGNTAHDSGLEHTSPDGRHHTREHDTGYEP